MADDPRDILDRIADRAHRDERVAVGDVIEALGYCALGLVPDRHTLIYIFPISSVRGRPTATMEIIVPIAEQLALRCAYLWLPGFVERRAVASSKANANIRDLARLLDRWFHARLPALTKGPFVRATATG